MQSDPSGQDIDDPTAFRMPLGRIAEVVGQVGQAAVEEGVGQRADGGLILLIDGFGEVADGA
jgi:hypothetical protein